MPVANQAGLTQSEVMDMTMCELQLWLDGYIKRQEIEAYRQASMMALIANIYRDSKKRPKPYKPEDFLQQDKQEKKKPKKKQQTPEDMLRAMELMVKAMGGKDLRKKGGESI